MTKNLYLRVTLHMYDGDVNGWHATDNSLRVSVSSTLRLLHVPRTTRYDQYEIQQTNQVVNENAEIVVAFAQGVTIPLPYRASSSLCTYTRAGTDGNVPDIDHVSIGHADHDKVCAPSGPGATSKDAQGGDVCAGGRCFGNGQAASGCSEQLGYRVSCVQTGADSNRPVIETMVVFDESEAPPLVSSVYQDGSPAWADAPMALPEDAVYQPAGLNVRAADSQWYRLRACPGTTSVSAVAWCTNTSSMGYNSDTSPVSHTAGACDVSRKGAGHDPVLSPATWMSPLQNSLSIDHVTGALLTDGTTMGSSSNFWVVARGALSSVPIGSLCFQGRSNFNTEDVSRDPLVRSPVDLRMIVVSRDAVTAHADLPGGGSTWTARSKSSAAQGAFEVHVASLRQTVTPVYAAPMWAGDKSVDGVTHRVHYVEERNLMTRAEISPQQTWGQVNTIVSGTLQPDVDCAAGNHSDVMCADSLRWAEHNNFHDQHIGRVQIKGSFQKTCGQQKMATTSWLPAGGLFDVYAQYTDDYPNQEDTTPGNGFALNGGAGYRISDSYDVACAASDVACARSILTQQFNGSSNGAQIVPGQAGGSICSIMYDDGMTSAQSASLRSSLCHIRDAYDAVGHDGKTWSDTVLNRVLVNKCTQQAGKLVCPAGALSARVIASNLRFRLPEKWSNCVRFKFEITVSNDDRNAPSYTFSDGTGADYSSPVATVYVEPQQRAEEPVMWADTQLADASSCVGNPDAACDGKRGVQAIGGLGVPAYTAIGPVTNLDGNDGAAMASLMLIAGYPTQVRVQASSAATDVRTEWQNPLYPSSNGPGYEWDSLRSSHKVSEERVYLTVESKYSRMVAGAADQRFCLWMCPSGTPAGSGCDKTTLVRARPVPDTAPDLATLNINCDACTGDDADGCHEVGIDSRGDPIKCMDQYGLSADIKGCPSYSLSTPFNNPGRRYSLACSQKGACPDFRNLYISVTRFVCPPI